MTGCPTDAMESTRRDPEGVDENELTRRLLRALIALRKTPRTHDVYDTFAGIVRRELEMAEVEVRVARPLAPVQRELLQQAIEAWLKRRISLTVVVDESLIGGVRVQVSGRVVDNSLKSQLDTIKDALLEA